MRSLKSVSWSGCGSNSRDKSVRSLIFALLIKANFRKPDLSEVSTRRQLLEATGGCRKSEQGLWRHDHQGLPVVPDLLSSEQVEILGRGGGLHYLQSTDCNITSSSADRASFFAHFSPPELL